MPAGEEKPRRKDMSEYNARITAALARLSEGGDMREEQVRLTILGTQVKKLRLARGINSSAVLAKRCGLPTKTILYLEEGLLRINEVAGDDLCSLRETIGSFEMVPGMVIEEGLKVRFEVDEEIFWDKYDSGDFDL